MITRRERRILAATAALAIGVPAGAVAWIGAARDALAARITEAGGAAARIGGVDADLTGAIRLTDVALGELVSADAIEARVAMGAWLGGRLAAGEVRVEGPRVALAVDPDGGSDLARLARRLARRAGWGSGRPRPDAHADAVAAGGRAAGLRRVVVTGGALTARVAGLGELSAEGVELVPAAGGVRVIAGPVRLRGAYALEGARPAPPAGSAAAIPVQVELAFAHGAAELALPEARLGRVLAVGGAGTARAGAGPLSLADVAAGRVGPDGALELRATVVDGAEARPLAIDVAGDGGAIAIRGDRVPLRALAALAALAALGPAGVDVAAARASGALTLRRRPGGLALSADAEIDGLVVDHPAFAARPTPLAGKVGADATISRDAIAWTRGDLALGAARLQTSGWLRRGAPLAGRVEAALAPAPCADLLAALPPELRGPLDGMALEGTLGARARVAIDLAAPPGEGAALEGALEGGCRVAAEPPAADVARLAAAGEQHLLDGSRRLVGPGAPDHVALRALPPHVPAAFVAAEDARFFEHAGFDLAEIARSLEADLRERSLVRGGSTISQQLVKNAFLSQRKSLERKLHEAVLAWRLEARLDKRQILERYLNVIELGPRVFGLGAAARYWFGASARELSIRQAAFLAALTAQPGSMSRRVRKAGGLDADSAERVAAVLRAMRAGRAITADAYADALTAPLRFARAALGE